MTRMTPRSRAAIRSLLQSARNTHPSMDSFRKIVVVPEKYGSTDFAEATT